MYSRNSAVINFLALRFNAAMVDLSSLLNILNFILSINAMQRCYIAIRLSHQTDSVDWIMYIQYMNLNHVFDVKDKNEVNKDQITFFFNATLYRQVVTGMSMELYCVISVPTTK